MRLTGRRPQVHPENQFHILSPDLHILSPDLVCCPRISLSPDLAPDLAGSPDLRNSPVPGTPTPRQSRRMGTKETTGRQGKNANRKGRKACPPPPASRRAGAGWRGHEGEKRKAPLSCPFLAFFAPLRENCLSCCRQDRQRPLPAPRRQARKEPLRRELVVPVQVRLWRSWRSLRSLR